MKIKSGSSASFEEAFEDCGSLPLGFRFHPTDEELVLYYLKRKICRKRLSPKIIGETDVYKCEPCELPEKSLLQSRDRQWFFFSRRDKKYPNGSRSNRATKSGYWKATGKDRAISRNSRTVGLKKTLVFYEGRAPKGDRTNWVMHEYTLDEEELKNCNAAQESYAIYKVFHKSGSGPKNGEQYGAPFREEEWADEDPIDDSFGNLMNEENLLPELTCGASVERFLDHNCCPHSANLEVVLIQQIADEPVASQQHPNGFTNISDVDGEEETQSYIMGSVPREAFSTEPVDVWRPCEQNDEEWRSFQITESATSYLQPSEALEVTSTFNCLQQGTHRTEEDWSVPREAFSTEPINVWSPCEQSDVAQRSFQITETATPYVQSFEALEVSSALSCLEQGTQRTEEDFLEINDLLGPDPKGLVLDSIGKNCNIPDTGEYFDAPMFFPEFNDSLDGHALKYFDGLTESDLSSQLHFHLPANFDDEDQNGPALITSDLWTYEQRFSVNSLTESNQVVMAPATNTGVVYGGSSTNLNEGTQNQVRNSESWLNSVVSALLDSVPTRPAAASESALINRAFERMSSFGALRIGARDAHVAAGVGAVVRRRTSRNRGFLFLSILGVFCAVFWLLTLGTTVKVLKVFMGKVIYS